MMQKKEKLSDKLSSTVFFWIAFGFACAAVLCMFLPALDLSGSVFQSRGIVNSAQIFFIQGPDPLPGAGAFIFVGYMLLVLAAILILVVALPSFHGTPKSEKIVIIASIVSLIIGSFLIYFTKPIFYGWCKVPLDSGYSSLAGPYVAGSLGIVSAALAIIGIKLDW